MKELRTVLSWFVFGVLGIGLGVGIASWREDLARRWTIPGTAEAATSSLTMHARGRLPARLAWDPSSLEFGEVDVGQLRDLTTRLTNTGQKRASGTIALPSNCEDCYSIIQGGGTFVLEAGQSRTVVIRATPPDTLDYPCVLSVQY